MIENPLSGVKLSFADVLAEVYAYILSWPDPEPDQQKTAPLADFGGKAGKADDEAELPVVASNSILSQLAGGAIEDRNITKTDEKTIIQTNSNKESSHDIVQNP